MLCTGLLFTEQEEEMKRPIGLQLYSVREDCANDLSGTLKQLSEMGYAGVEFAGYHGRTAAELKKMLTEYQLKCCGTHISIDTLLGEALKETIAFNQEFENRFLIVPGLPKERTESIAAWQETAVLFNEISEKVRQVGMYVGYHNHWIEFEPIDGIVPWDAFFEIADPDVVMQFDTGNALRGKGDPVTMLTRYPNRAKTVHLKEHSSVNENAMIGEGEVAWDEIFHLCETTGGTEWYIVEQESYAFSPLECVRRSLENLRKMGK